MKKAHQQKSRPVVVDMSFVFVFLFSSSTELPQNQYDQRNVSNADFLL